MSKKRTIERTKGDFRFVWTNGKRGDREVLVDVFHLKETEPFMEWSYTSQGIGTGLLAVSAFWQEQAELQATAEFGEREATRAAK